MTNDWKPEKGESYFLVSEYSDQPYAYVWEGNKADRDRHMHKTLYRTREEAEAVIRDRINHPARAEMLDEPTPDWEGIAPIDGREEEDIKS